MTQFYTLTHTPAASAGRCHSTDWLKKAGFASIESHADIPGTMPGGTLIIAEKN